MSLEQTIAALERKMAALQQEDQRIDTDYQRLSQRKVELAKELLPLEDQLAQLRSAMAIVEQHTQGQGFRRVTLGTIFITDAMLRIGIISNGRPLTSRQIWDACYALGARSGRNHPWSVIPSTIGKLRKRQQTAWRVSTPGLYVYDSGAGKALPDSQLIEAREALAQALGYEWKTEVMPNLSATLVETQETAPALEAEKQESSTKPASKHHGVLGTISTKEALLQVGQAAPGKEWTLKELWAACYELGARSNAADPTMVISSISAMTPGWHKAGWGRYMYDHSEADNRPENREILHKPVIPPGWFSSMATACICGDASCVDHRKYPDPDCSHFWRYDPPANGAEVGVCMHCLGVRVLDRNQEDGSDTRRSSARAIKHALEVP